MESAPLDVAPESAGPNPIDALRAACIPYVPTASATHFFMWLVFAAPARFFCLESASQVVVASRSHFVMKLLRAAPASFLSAASDLQVANAGADEIRQTASAKAIFFMAFLHSSALWTEREGNFRGSGRRGKVASSGWLRPRAVINCALRSCAGHT